MNDDFEKQLAEMKARMAESGGNGATSFSSSSSFMRTENGEVVENVQKSASDEFIPQLPEAEVAEPAMEDSSDEDMKLLEEALAEGEKALQAHDDKEGITAPKPYDYSKLIEACVATLLYRGDMAGQMRGIDREDLAFAVEDYAKLNGIDINK